MRNSTKTAIASVSIVLLGVGAGVFGLNRYVATQRALFAALASLTQHVDELHSAHEHLTEELQAERRRRTDELRAEQFSEQLHAEQKRLTDEFRALASDVAAARNAKPKETEQPQAPKCIAIELIPYVIRKSGSYCLSPVVRNYSKDPIRFAIAVMADDVEIDLMEGTLEGPRRIDHVSEGIYSSGYRNLVVRNGTISGFMYGIRVDPPLRAGQPGGTHTYRQLNIVDATFRGISVDFGDAAKPASIVSVFDTLISGVGGTTLFPDAFAIGIEIQNTLHCSIERSKILNVIPVGVGEGVAISLSKKNLSCVIKNNHMINAERPEWGRTIALWTASSKPNLVFTDNFVSNFTYALFNNTKSSAARNAFHSIDCSPGNTRNYYSITTRQSNFWLEESSSCSDRPSRFRAAAMAGDPRAQYRMARMILDGITIDSTDAEAARWLSLAAAQGLKIAADQLEGMRKAGKI